MAIEQVTEPQWIYTCDKCGKTKQSNGPMPDSFFSLNFFGSNWLGDRVNHKNRVYCYHCGTALFETYLEKVNGNEDNDFWIKK